LATTLIRKKFVLALLCYNEEESIETTLKDVENIERRILENTHLVVFDNNSEDKTFEVSEKCINSSKRISGEVKRNSNNLGYSGNAFQAVQYFRESKSDYLFIVDGDGQFPIKSIGEFVLELESGSNLVLTKRINKGSLEIRNFGSFIFKIMCALLVNSKLKDINGGFRALDQKLVSKIHGFPEGRTANPFLYFIAQKNSLRISWVPISPVSRIAGKSFLNFNKPLRLTTESFLELLRIRRQKYKWNMD
jgi:glycosyltransferase involved in cell wall biosynthesis